MAWLHTHPKNADGKPATLSRAQQIQQDGGHLGLPEITAQHLAAHLQNAGCCMPTGAGIGPISSAELRAWQAGTHTPMAGWEFAAVLNASRAYVTETHAESPNPPWGDLTDASDPAVLEARIRRALSGLASKPARSRKAQPSKPAH